MNLKDAYRYSKFLDSLIAQVGYHFNSNQNFIQTTEKHLRMAADSSATNEEVVVATEKTFEGDVKSLVNALNSLVSEKASLSVAIDYAKANTKVNWTENNEKLTIDSAVNINQSYRNIANSIARIKDLKTRNYQKQGNGFRINNEGNQTPYFYNIEVTDKIDFDRDYVVDNYKKLLTKADKISTAIDEAMASDIVDFDPRFNLYDTEKDVLAKYVS